MRSYRTATQWGVYDVCVENGELISVSGIKEDPDPSKFSSSLLDGVHHPSRIKRPAVRKGWLEDKVSRARHIRGEDDFVELPWDEVIELAAGELTRVKAQHGNRSIFGGSYGWASAGRFHHAQSQLHRFINFFGGCTRAMNSYSTAAAQVILPHVVAPWEEVELEQPSWRELRDETELFVAFGGIPLRNTQVAYGGITEHNSSEKIESLLQNGVEFINVSPNVADLPQINANQHILVRPNTDVAFMLGVAYVLEVEELLDRQFLSTHCKGYETFARYLLGKDDGIPKSPEWASAITDIKAEEIVSLARKMAAKRTFISGAWSLQRAHHGEQPFWMIVVLSSMLGGIGLKGQGFGFGYGAEGFIGSDYLRFPWATLPKGRNPEGFAIPVARIADMLLNPGDHVEYDGDAIQYPDVRLIYWAGGNPFHHHQDLNRLVSAWRRPDTVIVNEPWWSPIAKWADIVFPATTSLERQDICASSHDNYAHFMERALEPHHESKSDHEIFSLLANKLGFGERFTENKSEIEWLESIWQRSSSTAKSLGFELPSFDDFCLAGCYRLPDRDRKGVWLSDFRTDPMKNPLKTPSGLIEIYSDKIAGFSYRECPGHPVWLTPIEWLGAELANTYPLHLLSCQPATRLHSQYDQAQYSQDRKVQGCEVLFINPKTAISRGISDGDIVKVFNARGACLAGARYQEGLRRDVVVLPTGSWFNPAFGEEHSLELNGNPNALTIDIGTSELAQGPSAQTCLVEIEKADEKDLKKRVGAS